MYHIYIIRRCNVDYTIYQLYDHITCKVIIESRDKYEFKLMMNLMGIDSDRFKICNYSVYRNSCGGYTASIIMAKRITFN